MNNENFCGENAFKYLKKLAVDIGIRHVGTVEEKTAGNYILETLESFGLKSWRDPYSVYMFDKSEASITTSAGKEFNCLPAPRSQSTPEVGVTAEPVVIAAGNRMCLDPSMKGKIIISLSGFNGDAQKDLIRIQPAGVITIMGKPGNKLFTGPVKAPELRKFGMMPPMATVTYEDGMGLVNDLPETITLKVKTDGARMDEAFNVIAEIPGTDYPDEVILVGAHYDSIWCSPGAQDNGGGAVTVMELARILAKVGSKRTIRFILFSGEDSGCLGSQAYARKLMDDDKKQKEDVDFEFDGLETDLDRIKFFVNIDVIGAKWGSNKAWSWGSSDLSASVRLMAIEKSCHFESVDQMYGSDNMFIGYAGIPSISFSKWAADTANIIHTEDDVIETCTPESFEESGEFILDWISRYVTEAKVFPFAELPEDKLNDVKKKFKKNPLLHHEPFGPERRLRTPNKLVRSLPE